MSAPPIVLTIAGSDSSGGAGIQADLKAFAAQGCYGASVITALTAQNTQGVTAVHAPPPDFAIAQLDAVLDDLDVRAIKIGMLGDSALIAALAKRLAECRHIPIVLDPVMVATTGAVLVPPAAVRALIAELFPLAALITPNVPEAAVLLDWSADAIVADMPTATRALRKLGAAAVLLKGGHGHGEWCVDVLAMPDAVLAMPDADAAASDVREFKAARIATAHTHGSGCTLSSAIAAQLARGAALPEAIAIAKDYVSRAIAAAHRLRVGRGHGPLHHFVDWWPDA